LDWAVFSLRSTVVVISKLRHPAVVPETAAKTEPKLPADAAMVESWINWRRCM
jgi:hypothetical protein